MLTPSMSMPRTFMSSQGMNLSWPGMVPDPRGQLPAQRHCRPWEVPIVQIQGIMKNANYSGVLSIEFEGLEDPLQAIPIALKT